ncbi:TetR/AcrR family transcriptional regulator [Methanobacterium sp.]|uniref:TetR/AcrR family transcriptional regulator n=1 Tax=Methanobacterium sp. TaxID=2164 RepID=UPI003C742520
MSERMERRKKERRNEIMDVTEKMIARKGVQGMTMKEVAEEADVAIGTLYVYFKNKNSLCAAVNARINRQMRVMMEEESASCSNACKKIRATIDVVFEFREKYPDKWSAFKELLLLNYDTENIKGIYTNNGSNLDINDFKDISDENIRDLLLEDKKMSQLMKDIYKQGIQEGCIRSEIDLLPTIIFMRMALFTALEPLPYAQRMLEAENIDPEHFLEVVLDLTRHTVRPKSSEKR